MKRTTEGRDERERRDPLPSLLPVCRFKTSPCVPAKRAHVEHMRAFCRHTRKRFEPTHGDVLFLHTKGLSACQAAPHTPHTTHTTKHHNTKTQNAHPTHTLSTHTHSTLSTHTHNHFNTHAQHTTRHMHIRTPPSYHTYHTLHTHKCLDMCTAGNRP